MVLTKLDMAPAGAPYEIKAGFNFSLVRQSDLRPGSRKTHPDTGQTTSFTLGEGAGTKYRVLEQLGEGTYGIAYKAVGPDGKEYAIKFIKDKLSKMEFFVDFLKECAIQMIVVATTKTQTNGPYAPEIFDICYDTDTNEGYIRSALMRNTLDNLITAMTPAQNNAVVPDALKQVAKILDFLGTNYRFNHRDMKGDNIMYDRSADGRSRAMKLIDFGMSCLTFAGMKIAGSKWFDEKHTCYKEDRDLSQLVFYIQRYRASNLTAPLLHRLQLIVRANVGARHKCKMDKLCPAHGLSDWKNVYDFVDRANVKVPAGTAEFIQTNMQRFLEGKPFESPAPPAVVAPVPARDPPGICAPGKMKDPRTGRCVPNPAAPLVGSVGVAAGAAAPPVKKPSALARKPALPSVAKKSYAFAAPALAPAKPKDPCPPGKIMNPRTRRCVARDGKVGRTVRAPRRRD
jgi:serine/threonine protein kinase